MPDRARIANQHEFCVIELWSGRWESNPTLNLLNSLIAVEIGDARRPRPSIMARWTNSSLSLSRTLDVRSSEPMSEAWAACSNDRSLLRDVSEVHRRDTASVCRSNFENEGLRRQQ